MKIDAKERNRTLKHMLFAFSVGFVFLALATATLRDYSIMWDGRTRFLRGQAFVEYLFWGTDTYQNREITSDRVRYIRDYAGRDYYYSQDQTQLSDDPNFRRSIYQDDRFSYASYLDEEQPISHPPFSDIGAALTNRVFYGKLGILSDEHAYAFYAVVLASILVGVLWYWMHSVYGCPPAVIGTLALATTPLFWAQSHYNIKDIPELVYFALAVWGFYTGVVKVSNKWILLSALAAGAALGTKFNALFLPFILVPWLVYYFVTRKTPERKELIRLWPSFVMYPVLMFGVYVATWPVIWSDPVGKFLQSIGYYKEVGVNIDYTPAFRTKFGLSTYAIEWITLTTYPWVLLLFAVGVLGYISKGKFRKDTLPILALLWLGVPIVRASLPGTSIFGGVKHIAEYIPAIALLGGYGMYMITRIVKKRIVLVTVVSILLFVPLVGRLAILHPAENAYFNMFAGGLSGARDKGLTGWGNTDGGIYSIAIGWLNANATIGAHVAVGYSETADFYIPDLREDLIADNRFSGSLMEGEYIVALTHNSELEHTYRMKYPETYLEPVYVWSVDGVPLIKIWKNDRQHLKPVYKERSFVSKQLVGRQSGSSIMWDLGKHENVVQIDMNISLTDSCEPWSQAYLSVAGVDQQWTLLPESYPDSWVEALGKQPNNGKFTAMVVGLGTRFVRLDLTPANACLPTHLVSTITTQ